MRSERGGGSLLHGQTEAIRAKNTATRIITDDNMGVEWRRM